MKKLHTLQIIFVLLIITLSSFTFLTTDAPEDQYVGTWTTHWGKDLEGKKSSVDYVDTFKFELNQEKKLIMSCVSFDYFIFSKIQATASTLNFVVENTVDPGERFFINYNLKLVNKNLLKGTILNSRGKTVYISLKRVK